MVTMNNQKLIDQHTHIWQSFLKHHALSERQAEQFAHYLELLIEWNQRINLTAITDVPDVINYHFADSLALNKACDLKKVQMMCDVGSGGGLPGIPLAIAHPHLRVILIEIVGKKVNFLRLVAKELGMEDRIEVIDLDWRTFLRSTEYPIEAVCARASLRPDELVRMFRAHNSPYRTARLFYWATANWTVEPEEAKWFEKEVPYSVGDKERKIVIFKEQ